jgi:cytidylate kinase
MTTIQSAMQALMASANAPHHDTLKTPPRPVITISRDHGALGRVIADRLSQRLDIPVYDREILDRIAARLQTDPQTLKLLDESNARARDMWLMRLFTGKNLSEDAYREHLVNVVLSLSRVGGVILGRAGNVILATSCALRVRITASPEVCTRRVQDRYGVSEAEARAQIERVNGARGRFVWEMFQRRNSDATNFDLVLNTDRFDTATATDQLSDMLFAAYNGIIEAKRHAC